MEPLITLKQAAKLTGINESTIRKWLKKEQCPFEVKKTLSGRLFTTMAAIETGLASMKNYPVRVGD